MQRILECQVGAFSQTYLGLPLSHEKLKLSAFFSLTAKAGRYLSGWQAALLNPMGRSVLVNAVLDSQLIYIVPVLLLPQGTIDTIDRRRQSFLWSGEERARGAQCLVAWKNACQPKKLGGLGIKNLPVQNKCLLLKMLHRLHHPGECALAAWVRARVGLSAMMGEVAGAHWHDMAELLPLYRVVTISEVEKVCSTSFWKDRWLSVGRLSDVFPLLYTHMLE